MAMFDNLKKAVADTITSDIIMVDVDDLHESEDNFFEVERIEEFAETILAQGGVKENLIVMPRGSGGYELISGHRRTAAVRYLIENDKTVSRFLPCLVANYDDEDEKKLDIVLMNITARIISDAELWKSYEIVNEVLQKKKALGEKFGKVQNKLAELLGVSVGQVSKIQKIDNSAIPEVKQAVKSGEISINTANEISKLDIEKQKEVVSGKPLKDVKPKDVKTTEPPPLTKEDEELVKKEFTSRFKENEYCKPEIEKFLKTNPTKTNLIAFLKKRYVNQGHGGRYPVIQVFYENRAIMFKVEDKNTPTKKRIFDVSWNCAAKYIAEIFKDDEKGNINVTFSEKTESFPMFSSDVVTAWKNLDLDSSMTFTIKELDDGEISSEVILKKLMGELKKIHKENRRRKNV